MKIKSRFKNKKFLIVSFISLVIIFISSKFFIHKNLIENSTKKIDELRPNAILVQKIKSKKVGVFIELSGYIESKNKVELVPQTDGTIKDIKIQQGMKVNAGDIVLVLDEKDKVAEYKRTSQLVNQRKFELDSSNKLLKSGDTTVVSNNETKTSYNDALSQMERAKNNLDFTKIRSPISGYLDKLNVKRGDYVSQQTRIASIFDDKDLIVVFYAPQNRVQKISSGQKAIVLIDDRKVYGAVDFISNIADQGTKTYYGEIKLDHIDNDVFVKMIGAPVQAKIIFDEVNAIKLKDSSVYIDDSGDLNVKIIDKSGKVASRRVDLLENDNDGMTWFGSKEFKNNDEVAVIIRGAGFLNDGDEVKNIEYSE